MTGRKGRLVRGGDGRTKYSKRNEGELKENNKQVSMEQINLHERANFMEGRKLVAIISEAASSGISLQATPRRDLSARVISARSLGAISRRACLGAISRRDLGACLAAGGPARWQHTQARARHSGAAVVGRPGDPAVRTNAPIEPGPFTFLMRQLPN